MITGRFCVASSNGAGEMDATYWVMHPLDDEDVETLRRAKTGFFDHVRNRFSIAFLISQECLHLDGQSVSITVKGREAIRFFSA